MQNQYRRLLKEIFDGDPAIAKRSTLAA
jgi:hypothetical protein